MRPSAATRPAFLSALARPCLRSHSAEMSSSPLFSVSAFLHSIMPAPVRSRSSLTRDAVISAITVPRIQRVVAAGFLRSDMAKRKWFPACAGMAVASDRALWRGRIAGRLLGGRCFFGGGVGSRGFGNRGGGFDYAIVLGGRALG